MNVCLTRKQKLKEDLVVETDILEEDTILVSKEIVDVAFVEDLIISKAVANEGPRWKRFRAAGFGRANRILKRTSHIIVELEKK